MEFTGVFCLDFDGTTKEEIEEKYGEMRLGEGLFEDLEKRLLKELRYEVMLNSSHESWQLLYLKLSTLYLIIGKYTMKE